MVTFARLWNRIRGIATADVVSIITLVAITDWLFLTGAEVPVAQALLAVLTVLVFPGYATVAALFPEHGGQRGQARGRIDTLERLVLAVALSIVISPLLSLAVSYTPYGLEPVPIVTVVSVYTVSTALFAGWRRSGLPEDQRYRFPFGTWVRSFREGMTGSLTGAVAGVVVIVALSISVGGVGWAMYERPPGERLTEFYVVTEDGTDGTEMGSYPETLSVGEQTTLVVGVGNHEHRPEDYTVVTSLQRVNRTAETVTRYRELDRTETRTLAHGENWSGPVTVAPTEPGEDLRLTFALYRDDVPASPGDRRPYRTAHLWVDVTTG